jgi:predicted permease
MVDAETVTADYFAVLGVRPSLGRTFTAAEDAAGGPNVAMLSHRFWVSHFNADRGVINRVVQMDGKPHTIIGVMPSSFDYVKSSPNIWLPLALGPEDATRFGAHYLAALGRVRPGTTVQQARAAAEAAERSIASRMSTRIRPLSSYGADVRRLSDDLVRNYRRLLFILLGAVGCVLLIACGNVANLLLARGTTRAREFAIRAALGAGRGRLVRQLLAESLTLALVGAVAGLAVAVALLRMVRLISPDNVPRLEQAGIDWRVLGFTLLVGILSSVVFGLAPALRAVRPQLQQTLREGGRGSSAGRDAIRPVLVGAQVALTLVLLVGAALLIRSAWLIQHVDPGFDPRGVLTARVLLPGERYPSGESIVRAFIAMRQEAAQIPGVESAALGSVVPMSGSRMSSSISAEDRPRGEQDVDANLRMVSDGYFRTMRIPLIAGRDVARTDGAESTPVAVVNVALARTLWPGVDPRDAIGRRIRAVPTRRTDLENWEVVGIVGDLHDAALTERPVPEMYTPFAQTPDAFWPYLGRSLVIVLREPTLDGSVERLTRQLQRAITRVDASLPLADTKSMEDYLAGTLATARMNTLLLSTLGGIALVLAIVGIYGVVSYFVSQRTQEIGIRVALGSSPAGIWRLVVERGMRPVVVGIGVGVALSLITSTLLRSQLFGVAARDPVTIIAVGVLLAIVSVIAMYLPARRAMRVSPIVALASS